MIEYFYTGVLVVAICFFVDHYIFGINPSDEAKEFYKEYPLKVIIALIIMSLLFPLFLALYINIIYRRLKK